MRIILSGVLLASLLITSGCQSISYYGQSIKGQFQVIYRSQSIEELLGDDNTPTQLKDKLIKVKEIRQFASGKLKLPDNDSYKKYANIDREYVVWNLFAAGEFSLQPYLWCYPVIGCQAYRGYFSKKPVLTLANEMQAQGYDVSVGGVRAYSTLGWFNDPVLNTFIHYSSVNMASLIIHELSHQIVYVEDDTVFNESFATLVETKGVEVWLASIGDEGEIERYHQRLKFESDVLDLIAQYKVKLNELYSVNEEQYILRNKKNQIFRELKAYYQQLKLQSDQISGWDAWFSKDLNNAHLVAIGTYYEKVEEFEALFSFVDGDFKRFYDEVKKLATLEKSIRDEKMAIQRLPR